MPEIVIYAVAGRSLEQKHGLLKDVTEAVVKNFNVDPDIVTVQIVEAPPELKSKGGIPYSVRMPNLIGKK
ncbi:MAG: tautomerase family protein [Hyphomonadaceae bacterium]|nr:tautomerase family protein [Hyphomonadaceae bacterium]